MHHMRSQIIVVVTEHAPYLQISCILLIVQVGEPIDKVIEDSARQEQLLNIVFKRNELIYKKKNMLSIISTYKLLLNLDIVYVSVCNNHQM